MAFSASSLLASPPWQLTQLKPFCEWTSWLNLSSVTPKGSGKAAWQSRQELWACPKLRKAVRITKQATATCEHLLDIESLFRKMAIHTHTCHVGQSEHPESGDPQLHTRGI